MISVKEKQLMQNQHKLAGRCVLFFSNVEIEGAFQEAVHPTTSVECQR